MHTTLFSVPANTKVNVTIFGYDGCTPMRNNYWSQVQGTIGGTVTVQQFNKDTSPSGHQGRVVINSWATCAVGHTFAIPCLGADRSGRVAQALNSRTPLQLVSVHPQFERPYTAGEVQLHDAGATAVTSVGSASSPAAAATSTATAVPCSSLAT